VVFACGGTGGHIFPAIAVAEEILRRRPDARITYVCGKKDIESAILKNAPHGAARPIDSAPFAGLKSLLRPSFLKSLASGFRRCAEFLREEKPHVVVGFGGYVSFPAVVAARFMGIPTLIHEQNVAPGFANRVLARVARGVALSYEETGGRLGRGPRVRVTGNPIRSSIERDCRREALEFFGFAPDRRTVLVLGGSQGAESINVLFLAAAETWVPALKERTQVLHLCGRMKPEEAERRYAAMGLRSKAYSFFDRMDLAYGAADVAVGRAGATFLAEVAVKRIPTILIPYPFGDGHQRHNARAYARGRDAVVVEQETLTPATLASLVGRYLDAPGPPFPETAPAAQARVRLADFILENAAR